MEPAITTADLADKAGISLSYASEIVNGKRQPSRALAIHILRKTGSRHSVLAGLSKGDIETLERVDPWAPRTAEPTPSERAA